MTQTAAPAQLALTFADWTPSHHKASGISLRKDSPAQVAAQDRVNARNGKRYVRFAGKLNLRPFSSTTVPPLVWL